MPDVSNHRDAVRYWGSDVTAMIMQAKPGTQWFAEVRSMAERGGLDKVAPLLVGADFRDVCSELGMSVVDLAAALAVQRPSAYAIGAGWKRLTPRSLVKAAGILGVPLGTFIHDEHFQKRQRVLLYEQWQLIENRNDRAASD